MAKLRNGPKGPSKPNFGRLNKPEPPRPPAPPPASAFNNKRSATIALAVLGTGAVGLIVSARSGNCQPSTPDQPVQSCRTGSGSWSTSSSSSWRSSSTSTSPSQNAVVRGGFGNSSRSFFGRIGA